MLLNSTEIAQKKKKKKKKTEEICFCLLESLSIENERPTLNIIDEVKILSSAMMRPDRHPNGE